MIICDYFLRIYKNYANLRVINGVLRIKLFFATDRAVWVTTGAAQKSQNGQFKVFQFVNFEAHKK